MFGFGIDQTYVLRDDVSPFWYPVDLRLLSAIQDLKKILLLSYLISRETFCHTPHAFVHCPCLKTHLGAITWQKT
jgi:hypothetical protein